MGKGSDLHLVDDKKETADQSLSEYSWKEIKDDTKKWIVINGIVYDVSKFSKKHPGGERLMMNHVGQDVSDAFQAFHNDMKKVGKYLKTIQIGKVPPESDVNEDEPLKHELNKDFRNLRQLAEKMELYQTNFLFYFLHFFQIVILELIAAYILYVSGYNNWMTYFLSVALIVIAQAQAGWLQHDFGHLSVFKSSKMNHFMHKIVISTIKGVSSDWWNYRHFQHHAKPNTLKKDPDVRFGPLFVLGKIIPRELGQKKLGKFPYQYQQNYFLLLIPPLLLPLYFNFENIYFLKKKKSITEALWIVSFIITWGVLFGTSLGFFGAIKLYLFMRFIESHWFVTTTQMSHIPMAIDRDHNYSWFRSQLLSTCNVEQSLFNDWFSGHLNFQIEHHLFPTMPRHNYHKIAPYVKSLCEKYQIPYLNKSLSGAMADIYISLKESGEIWYDAYNM